MNRAEGSDGMLTLTWRWLASPEALLLCISWYKIPASLGYIRVAGSSSSPSIEECMGYLSIEASRVFG